LVLSGPVRDLRCFRDDGSLMALPLVGGAMASRDIETSTWPPGIYIFRAQFADGSFETFRAVRQ
jgi:hypothetical protein